jgi:hypothetical protein
MYFQHMRRAKSELHPPLVSISVRPTAGLFGRYPRPFLSAHGRNTDTNSLLPVTVGSKYTMVPPSGRVYGNTRVHERDARWRLVGGRQACLLFGSAEMHAPFFFPSRARGCQESSWISPPCCWDLLRPQPPRGPPRPTCAREF